MRACAHMCVCVCVCVCVCARAPARVRTWMHARYYQVFTPFNRSARSWKQGFVAVVTRHGHPPLEATDSMILGFIKSYLFSFFCLSVTWSLRVCACARSCVCVCVRAPERERERERELLYQFIVERERERERVIITSDYCLLPIFGATPSSLILSLAIYLSPSSSAHARVWGGG